MDEFEQFLKQQPLRRVPASWRREILAATVAPVECKTSWRQLLWPSPIAWAVVAAAWLLIIGLNVAAQPSEPQTANREPVSPREIAMALVERRKLLNELTGPAIRPVPRPADPGPHSRLMRDISESRYA